MSKRAQQTSKTLLTKFAWKSSKAFLMQINSIVTLGIICREKGKSLNDCHSLVNWDHFLSVCMEKACECLKNERENECKCKAATNFVSQCNAFNPPNLDLSNWRVELGCRKS